MIGTYAAALAVCAASLSVGQAAIALCGARRWSWLSPAVGLALVCAISWATVRPPGGGWTSSIAVVGCGIAGLVFLRGRLEGGGEAFRMGVLVALPALALVSLPFVVEGHLGILGTGFNPDMSQHLLAADRLAAGSDSQLLAQGYPLGSHAIVVALGDGLGIGPVQAFGGLTLAVAVLAALTALSAFADQPPLRRTAAAILVGLPYLVASYFAQGAFKEVMQALFLLGFVLALRETARPEWSGRSLRFVPAAAIAIGSVYVYSFPGLLWLVGAAGIWAATEWAVNRYGLSAGGVGEGGVEDALARSAPPSPTTGPAALRPMLLALAVFLVGALPELGRMIDFQQFETFDPAGPGLGNLFGQLSPLEALGIWPSGDFRVAPGDGAVPAVVYYLGAAFAAALLIWGAIACWRRRETAVLAGLLAAAGLYAAARLGGTPYAAAKALEIAAPLLTLTILLPLVQGGVVWRVSDEMDRKLATRRAWMAAELPVLCLGLYLLAALGCSLLALANAPVGPSEYSPRLTELRRVVGEGPTLVIAPDRLLAEEHGERYLVWELRGGRVCIERESAADGAPPVGVRFVITRDDFGRPPYPGFELRRRAAPYLLWERRGDAAGRSRCPLIAVRQARQGP